MNSYRFRTDDAGLLILQVLEAGDYNTYYGERRAVWRDAKVTDLTVVEWMAKERQIEAIPYPSNGAQA